MEKLDASDDYESPALDWLFDQVDALRQVLESEGVADDQSQRRICETFFFRFAVELDGGTVPPRSPQPKIIFDDGNRALASTDMFDFHDYVFGVVAEAFGDG